MRPPTELIDEAKVGLTFVSWLSSVTERVNQTMHYQFPGSPEPLVFHAPQVRSSEEGLLDETGISHVIELTCLLLLINVNKTGKAEVPCAPRFPRINWKEKGLMQWAH